MVDLVAYALAALEALEGLAGAAGGAAIDSKLVGGGKKDRISDSQSTANITTFTTTPHGHCHGFLRSLRTQSISPPPPVRSSQVVFREAQRIYKSHVGNG